MTLVSNAVSKEMVTGISKQDILNLDQTVFNNHLVKQSYGLWNSFTFKKRSTLEYDTVKGETESHQKLVGRGAEL